MAYTKYSLTPANNTATPPDGAPEGMLPSAVNDTMRDMMAQIRDCGDGIRDGTYTMTAPKITGGTITGSTINNSAIGGTTAAAGAFTTLSATGVTTVQAGTVSLPAITTTGDTNTGIFFPAADTIAFTEGGVESMRIDSSGNVGIGTSTPGSFGKLVVKTSSTSEAAGLAVMSSTNDSFLTIYNSGSVHNIGATYSSTGSYQPIAFVTSGSERMRIDSSGNVCVGSTAAGNAGTLNVSVGLAGTTVGGLQLWSTTAATHYVNFGDGTTGTDTYRGYVGYAHGSDALLFGTSTVERMRITSAGYLKASNTGVYVSSTGIYHEMISDGDNTSLIVRNTNGSLTAGGVLYVDANRNTTNNAFYAIAYYNNGAGAYKFQVADSGNVTNTNNSYGAISDVKLKENIVDASPKLKDLCKVKVRQYNLKSDPDHKQIGVVAQELEEVFAGLVEETADKDREGNYLGTTTKQVKYSVFVPMLIKAMQEQQALIENLTTRLNALEGK